MAAWAVCHRRFCYAVTTTWSSTAAATRRWCVDTTYAQEFITPHTPEQNGMIERLIRTLKEQCVHRHRFETLQHAARYW